MLAGLLTITLVSGCGLVEHTDSKEDRTYDAYEEPIETGMEQTPVIFYEIPDMQIGVLVNRTGYSKDGEKKVFSVAATCRQSLKWWIRKADKPYSPEDCRMSYTMHCPGNIMDMEIFRRLPRKEGF